MIIVFPTKKKSRSILTIAAITAILKRIFLYDPQYIITRTRERGEPKRNATLAFNTEKKHKILLGCDFLLAESRWEALLQVLVLAQAAPMKTGGGKKNQKKDAYRNKQNKTNGWRKKRANKGRSSTSNTRIDFLNPSRRGFCFRFCGIDSTRLGEFGTVLRGNNVPPPRSTQITPPGGLSWKFKVRGIYF